MNLLGVKGSRGRSSRSPTLLSSLWVWPCSPRYRPSSALVTIGLPVDPHHRGQLALGDKGSGLLLGASMFLVLRAFASGGAAVTGVEAISDGVPAFKEPAWRNARTTLTIMGATLAVMFLGLSSLAAKMHVGVYQRGTPTVISQIGKLVFGETPFGHFAFFSLQAGTLLILVLAANTSFADFPRLANFAAADHFMPRQLTKRGHRLVFSNGILALAGTSIVVILATEERSTGSSRSTPSACSPASPCRRREWPATTSGTRRKVGGPDCSSTASARS